MTRKITNLAMLATLAIMCSYIEMIIPNPFSMPGMKLGLANSIVMISIYLYSPKEAYIVSVVRVVLVSLLFADLFSFWYSLAGCTCSMIAMYIGYKSELFSIVGNSVLGAVFHNIGQLLVCIVLLDSIYIGYYFVGLLISGVVTGLVIGRIAQPIVLRIKSSH